MKFRMLVVFALLSGCRTIVPYDDSVQVTVQGATVAFGGRNVVAQARADCPYAWRRSEITLNNALYPEREEFQLPPKDFLLEFETDQYGRFATVFPQGTFQVVFESGELRTKRWLDVLAEDQPQLDLGDVVLFPEVEVTLEWPLPARRRVLVVTDEDAIGQATDYGRAVAIDGPVCRFRARGDTAVVVVLDVEELTLTQYEVELDPSRPVELTDGVPVDVVMVECAGLPSWPWPWIVDDEGQTLPYVDLTPTRYEYQGQRREVAESSRDWLRERLYRMVVGRHWFGETHPDAPSGAAGEPYGRMMGGDDVLDEEQSGWTLELYSTGQLVMSGCSIILSSSEREEMIALFDQLIKEGR